MILNFLQTGIYFWYTGFVYIMPHAHMITSGSKCC